LWLKISILGFKNAQRKYQKIHRYSECWQSDRKRFFLLGFTSPSDLIEQDPYALHAKLCEITKVKHDPCVIDVFISAIRFMQGEQPQKWWFYTDERKRHLAHTNENPPR